MTTHERVLRWTVPIDDKPHFIGDGHVLLVDQKNDLRSQVEVWTWEILPENWPDEGDDPTRMVQVFGTGQPLPATVEGFVGSCIDKNLGLVWHVFQVKVDLRVHIFQGMNHEPG